MLIEMENLPVTVLLIAGAYFSFYSKKLTLSAAVTGAICGLIIYLGANYAGLGMLAAFFISGTLATAWGRKTKQLVDQNIYSDKTVHSGQNFTEVNSKVSAAEQRKYGQVLANAGTATIFSLLACVFPAYAEIFLLMTATSLASATADTLSSELGILYGKRFYNCLSWKKEERGLDGVISLEGTLIGVLGAVLIGFIYAIIFKFDSRFLIIIIAGVTGNFSDSVLGASLERRHLLNNDLVNFLSTFLAACIALLLTRILL